MRNIAASLPFAGLTVLCWGSYGPILHASKEGMGKDSWAQLLCVGIAYFLIAVIIPVIMLRSKGEQGKWTKDGFFFGLAAGTFGALGALGIITALTNGGDPIYVMPIVFGGAPVVNTLVSMWIGKLFGKATNGFYLGIILVAVGAAGVFITKPSPASTSVVELTSVVLVIAGIVLTVFCWGSYGTVLHKSQAKMGGSRLRPFFCVGVAYFLIAIIVPLVILSNKGFPDWNAAGVFGSLTAGVCGALGALGIILSFTFGGKPVFVMPLVFGGAPIVNTLIGVAEKGTGGDGWAWFVASLTLVIVGAITTLVCAPKAGPGKADGDDEGDADSPQPGDDQAPATADNAAGDAAADPETEFDVDEDELDTVAAGSLEALGLAGGETDKEENEFRQRVEELGTVVAGSLDELESKLEDSRMANEENGFEVDEDGLDTVAADPIDDLDPPVDDTVEDEETDEEQQHDR